MGERDGVGTRERGGEGGGGRGGVVSPRSNCGGHYSGTVIQLSSYLQIGGKGVQGSTRIMEAYL